MLEIALPAEPLYLPFEAGPYRMSMGLVARPAHELISVDEHYPAEIAQRRRILEAHRPEVIAAEPGAEPACAALLHRLADVLPRLYPAWFERRHGSLRNHLTGETWKLTADP